MSLGKFKLGELGEVSLGKLKLGELSKVSLRKLKLGEVSFGGRYFWFLSTLFSLL